MLQYENGEWAIAGRLFPVMSFPANAGLPDNAHSYHSFVFLCDALLVRD